MIFKNDKLFIHQHFFILVRLLFSFSSCSLPCIPGTFQNEVKKASCKNCDAGRYRPSKKDDEWTFIVTAQTITASAGVAVTQTVSGGVVTGVLKTALTGADTESVVVTVTTDGLFISTTDIVIGTGVSAITIAHITITKADKTPTDPTTCSDCPSGRYQPEDASAACLPCVPGTYNGLTGQESCKECAENTFTDTTEKESCEPCDTGKTSPIGSASCSPCAAGTAGAKCTPCVQGKFRSGSDDQAEICRDCLKGFYQGDEGQGSCLPCIPGQYNDQLGLSKCKNCVENTFTDSTEKQSCEPCGTGKKAEEGSASCQRCGAGYAGTPCTKCLAGEFRAGSDTDATTCDSCPKGTYQSAEGQGSW